MKRNNEKKKKIIQHVKPEPNKKSNKNSKRKELKFHREDSNSMREDDQIEENEQQPSFNSCEIHPVEEMSYFCISNYCKNKLKSICSQCVDLEHQRHNVNSYQKAFEGLERVYQKKRQHLLFELKKRDEKLGLLDKCIDRIIQNLTSNIRQIKNELESTDSLLRKEDENFESWIQNIKQLPQERMLKEILNTQKIPYTLNGINNIVDRTLQAQKEITKLITINKQYENANKNISALNSIHNIQLANNPQSIDQEIMKSSQQFFQLMQNGDELQNGQQIEIKAQDIDNNDQYKLQLLKEMKQGKQQQVSISCLELSDINENQYLQGIMKLLKQFKCLKKLSITSVNVPDGKIINRKTPSQYVNGYNLKSLTHLQLDSFTFDFNIVKNILQKPVNLTSINLRLIQETNNFTQFQNLLKFISQLNLTEIQITVHSLSRIRGGEIQVPQQVSFSLFSCIKQIFQEKRETLKVFKLKGIIFKFTEPYSLFEEITYPSLERLQIYINEHYMQFQAQSLKLKWKIFEVFPSIKEFQFCQHLYNSNFFIVNRRQKNISRILKLLSLIKSQVPFRKEIVSEILYNTQSHIFI